MLRLGLVRIFGSAKPAAMRHTVDQQITHGNLTAWQHRELELCTVLAHGSFERRTSVLLDEKSLERRDRTALYERSAVAGLTTVVWFMLAVLS